MEPDPSVLSSINEPPELPAELDRYASLIDSALAFGTHLLTSVLDSGKGLDSDSGTALAVAALQFRWFLELVGGLSAQVRAGWADPAAVTMRAMFEASMGFEYLVSDRASMLDRSRAYLYMSYRRRLDFLDTVTPRAQRDSDMAIAMQKDRHFNTIPPPAMSDQVEAERQTLISGLTFPEYATAHSAYTTLKRSRPDWYEFYGGPKGLEQLARTLGRIGEYELFYRAWSRTAHGQDVVTGKLRAAPDGKAALAQLRHMNELHGLVRHATTLCLMTFTTTINSLAPQMLAPYNDWYLTVRDDYLRESRLAFS